MAVLHHGFPMSFALLCTVGSPTDFRFADGHTTRCDEERDTLF